jgi:molecular chaperone GrpE
MPSSPGSSEEHRRGQAVEDRAPAPASGAPGDGAPEQEQGADGGREPQLREEIARLDDRYKRALADLDNYRKRSARELEWRMQEARDALLREWLEAIDSVERAVRMDSGGPLAEGMRAVLDQMDAILARNGVQRIGAAGERFDPERHEAVGVREADDVPDQTVVEVARSGFAVGDRVLRPAQVIVARRGRSQG